MHSYCINRTRFLISLYYRIIFLVETSFCCLQASFLRSKGKSYHLWYYYQKIILYNIIWDMYVIHLKDVKVIFIFISLFYFVVSFHLILFYFKAILNLYCTFIVQMLVLWFNISTSYMYSYARCYIAVYFSLASKHILCYRSYFREFTCVIYFIYLNSLN